MLVTPSGMTRLVISSPFRNKRWAKPQGLDASFPKETAHQDARSEMRTSVNPEQPWNASLPTFVTLLGIVIDVSPEQS